MTKRVKRESSHTSNRVMRDGDKKSPTRSFSKKQEDTVAKIVGGNRQPNSGATLFAKGDVNSEQFLIECKTKTTHSDSLSIKKEWIDKISKEALFCGKPNWALSFSFGPNEENYFIIDEQLFKELLNAVALGE